MKRTGGRPAAIGYKRVTTDIPIRAVGYVRVSTEEQSDSGASLKAQRRAIKEETARRGWELMSLYADTASGKSLVGRPGLEEALKAVEGGGAEALVVAKLDRLSRSTKDFALLIERAARSGWSPVVLDLGVDTTTPSGELVANVMVSVAQWERRAIGQRTKDALAQKKREGVRLGRPSTLPEAVRRRIARLREKGLSYPAIADRLNKAKVPTAQGGRQWYPSTVRKALLVATSSTSGSSRTATAVTSAEQGGRA
jgi:DNA invertase Pin-like site-specific DNA recombinase